MALAPSRATFLAASFIAGVASVAAQIIVPFGAHLASDASRGRVVGNVTSGLLLGILLAMPAASLVAHAFGWRTVFGTAAGLMAVLAVALRGALPERKPGSLAPGYGAILRSLLTIFQDTPVLRRRAAYQAALFGGFSLFWTAAPLLLAGPNFGSTQQGIALFALAGAAGAAVAPVAGRLANRGWSLPSTGLAIVAVGVSFVLALIAAKIRSISLLMASALLLNIGVWANLVLSQRAIFALRPEVRGRLNALFMTIFVAGGAVGSAVAGFTYAQGGWNVVSYVGMLFACGAFFLYLVEWIHCPRAD
jgi:predicted MFS family arabinose efflux permease